MAYEQYGPFTEGVGPGVSADFLNGVEDFLLDINSVATDSQLSSSSGVIDARSILLLTGGIRRISIFSGTGSGVRAHGLGETPNFISINYAGNFGSPPTQVPSWHSAGVTNVTVSAQSGYFWWGLAIRVL